MRVERENVKRKTGASTLLSIGERWPMATDLPSARFGLQDATSVPPFYVLRFTFTSP